MHPIPYQWIETDQQLAEICHNARMQPVVTLDTEFIRIRTYYAKLGLIQLFDGNHVALIDPLAINDFTPFVQLLADTKVLKVLHACSEDLEVFHHYFQQMPVPMLDTQIMAGFAGLGTSVGFAKLVQHYLNTELDKGASRTDWLARPLSEKQLQYAAADVWYLLPIYHQLATALAQTPWENAVQEECRSVCTKVSLPVDLDKAYKDISNAWQLNAQQLSVLHLLAKWRIEEAIKRDLALNFIVKEQSLWRIAKEQPKHTSALLEFMHPNEVRIHGKKLLRIVEQSKHLAQEDYPDEIMRIVDFVGYKPSLQALQRRLSEILPENLPIELLASKRQLNQLFGWQRKGENTEKLPELLIGWRRAFGLQLLETLRKIVVN
ncbi:Ribonuclease D [Bibersteinia trehalosi USDA-ARS-USMARC-188]|uniref:Ribonuclease D n=1 Tax=Bibersteinia trehalosi USDA-ARS-USMARC-188 TaxID=1263829 RepID=A0A4V7I9V0_BIBTR|nr:ribonuclease D [Bibersteinia trehalosi]AHG81804.1 Ribonuclease D [Bibersteinia trehalosi USDA-ARS-USMARC-188]